jgi:hypothetical protein
MLYNELFLGTELNEPIDDDDYNDGDGNIGSLGIVGFEKDHV